MTPIETRIRAHYTRELHPMVFELLDVLEDVEFSYRRISTCANVTADKNARLRAAIEAAPHEHNCSGWRRIKDATEPSAQAQYIQPGLCDCWKRAALENPK